MSARGWINNFDEGLWKGTQGEDLKKPSEVPFASESLSLEFHPQIPSLDVVVWGCCHIELTMRKVLSLYFYPPSLKLEKKERVRCHGRQRRSRTWRESYNFLKTSILALGTHLSPNDQMAKDQMACPFSFSWGRSTKGQSAEKSRWQDFTKPEKHLPS